MRVGLVYNLKGELQPGAPPDTYAEFDDPVTIDAVRAALAERHDVIPIEAGEEAYPRLRETRPDIAFNVAEGFFGTGREAQIPCMLEMLRIPYTGSDPVTLAISLDKRRTREVLLANGIPTPRQVVIERPEGIPEARRRLESPRAIVKPIAEGSSKGIPDNALVDGEREWRDAVGRVLSEYRQPAVAEEFLPGR